MEIRNLHLNPQAEFAGQMPGKVVTPTDSQYETARRAWDLSVDQHPAIIYFVETVQDVVDAICYAHANGLPVAVQSTGHGVIHNADDAALINTSRMKGLSIDAEARTAWVEAGVKWGQVLELTQQFGLAPLLGSSPDVGAIGYTLGGGMGWLARKYGLNVDSVLRMQVVTPDGVVRQASQEENPDLFWALRGGGGGFGVVTSMEIKLYPVEKVYAGNLFYPPQIAQEVFQRFNQWADKAPEELTTSIVLMNFPPLPHLPASVSGQSFVIVRGCYTGKLETGAEIVEFWRSWRPPIIDDFKTIAFSNVAGISQDPVDPMPSKMTGGWLRDLSPETASALIHYTLPQAGPPSLVMTEVRLAGGAISRVNLESNAYSHRDEKFAWMSLGIPMNLEMGTRIAAQIEALRSALGASLTEKVYMNFLGGEEACQRTSDGYSEKAFARLQEIKAKYDPDNMFSYGYCFNK